MAELQARSGVQARTLRHWIRKRVLPKPVGRGRGARYTEGHVLRARVARQLRGQKLALEAIRSQLSRVTDADLPALLPRAPAGPIGADGVPLPPPPPTYPFVAWDVVSLADGLVLLVNTTRGPLPRRIAEAIYQHYGALPVAAPR